MSSFLADLRYALRQLSSQPGFTLVAVLTLALGIGANTAIFSVVDAVLLKPLPVGDPERLVMLYHSYPKLDLEIANVSPPGFVEYRQRVRSFSSLSAYTSYQAPATLTGAGEPRRIRGLLVSAEFFTTLGVRPALGRGFVRSDEEPGQRVAVISRGLWQQVFGADLQVVGKGRKIRLDEVDYTVVGVMPAGFRYPGEVDVWVPLSFTPAQLGDDQRGSEFLDVVARLRPETTLAAARAEMAGLSAAIRQRLAIPFLSTAGWHLRLVPLRERVVGDVRPVLLILLAAVGTVLLIACANLANLLLARTAARGREIALRNALGAGRGRVVRQLITESLLLAGLGGGLGILLAAWGVGALEAIRPDQLPPSVHLEIDLRVLLFTCGLSLAAGLLFGLAPALRAARGDLQTPLRAGGRGLAGSRSGLRGSLVVAEVALALILLAGAGLLLRSLARLNEAQPGFAVRGRLTFQLALPASRYAEPARAAAFFTQLAERLASLPAVRAAGAVSTLPLSGGSPTSSYRYESLPRGAGDAGPHGCPRVITPGYLRTLGIPLLRGRDFSTADRAGSLPVALIDEQAARRYFPGRDPLGERLTFDGSDSENPVWYEIVGVTGHVREAGPGVEGKEQIYLPLAQMSRNAQRELYMVIATAGDPLPLAAEIEQQVHDLDPDLPVYDLATLEQRLARSVSQPRFSTLLITLFAALAVTLAAVGLYGLMAWSVSQRTQEIGVRMALGAGRGQVLRERVAEGVRLTAWGLALGLAGALAASRLLRGMLFEIDPTDPWTLAGVTLLLSSVALLASWLPARRAARLDPQIALRRE